MQRIRGLSNRRQYHILSGMKQRCYNKNNQHYNVYGARGITICDEWLGENGASNFFEWSLEHGYDETFTIDRIDNNKGYSPNNCVWLPSMLNSSKQSPLQKLYFICQYVPTFELEYLMPIIDTLCNPTDKKWLKEALADVEKRYPRKRLPL